MQSFPRFYSFKNYQTSIPKYDINSVIKTMNRDWSMHAMNASEKMYRISCFGLP